MDLGICVPLSFVLGLERIDCQPLVAHAKFVQVGLQSGFLFRVQEEGRIGEDRVHVHQRRDDFEH
eukprot:8871612-Lingulodinium_polyedra.AAC.1